MWQSSGYNWCAAKTWIFRTESGKSVYCLGPAFIDDGLLMVCPFSSILTTNMSHIPNIPNTPNIPNISKYQHKIIYTVYIYIRTINIVCWYRHWFPCHRCDVQVVSVIHPVSMLSYSKIPMFPEFQNRQQDKHLPNPYHIRSHLTWFGESPFISISSG